MFCHIAEEMVRSVPAPEQILCLSDVLFAEQGEGYEALGVKFPECWDCILVPCFIPAELPSGLQRETAQMRAESRQICHGFIGVIEKLKSIKQSASLVLQENALVQKIRQEVPVKEEGQEQVIVPLITEPGPELFIPSHAVQIFSAENMQFISVTFGKFPEIFVTAQLFCWKNAMQA